MFTSSATWCATGVSRSSRSARDRLDPHLQREVRDDRGEVAVAGALAVAVDRALHLDRAAAHAGERVGHAGAGVVVEVHRDRRRRRRSRSTTSRDDPLDLVRQRCRRWCRTARAASRPLCGRGFEHAQRELGVAACSRRRSARRRSSTSQARAAEELDRVADHRHALVERGLQRLDARGSPTHLPTMHTVDVPASTRCRSVSSTSTLPFSRRVEPNATSDAVLERAAPTARAGRTRRPSGWRPASRPRCSATPSQSSCSAMRSLSSTVSEMPSSCEPSRSVVS